MESTAAAHSGNVGVVVIDDHPAIRAGAGYWFSSADPPIEVVASAEDVKVAWIGPGATADVVVLDLQLSGPTPQLSHLRRLTDAGRKVVVYTMHEDDDLALQSLELGALSYLTKAEGEKHLVKAVRAAADGLPYTPPILAGALAGDCSRSRPALSARESEVLIEWFQSDSKDFVAKKLGISVSTVNSYLERVRVKYAQIGRAAPTKAALVARAIQDRIIDVNEL